MALLYNGFRQVRGHLFGVTAMDGANPSMMESRWHTTARMRNQLVGNGITNKLASIPAGKRHPNVWFMPQVGGSIGSYRRGGLTIDAVATGELGFPRSGSTSITITGTCAGGLIVGATGTATIRIDGTAAIVATLNATGTATITIDGSVAMGAEASLMGTGTITIDGHVDAMALGYMTGTTEEAGLTPSGIARAVWQALATANNDDGTMGKLLNSAGTGGVDYDLLAQAILAAAQVTPIHSEMMKTNGQTIIGDGTEGNKFRSSLVG